MGLSKHSRYVQERRRSLLHEFSRLKFGGAFRGKCYEHILAKKEDVVKLLVDEGLRSPGVCKKLFGGKEKFQAFAHHVNSSQIMCLNYLGPLLLSHQDILPEVLRAADVELKGRVLCLGKDSKSSLFEYQPQIIGDRTNFDLYLYTDEGEEVFVEAKYTENEFGKPTKGSLKDSEWEFYERLCDRSLNLKGITKSGFYSNFQVNRNVAHVANERQHCLFFIPRSNPSLRLPSMSGFKNVSVLYVEDVVEVIERCSCDDEIKAYYRKLHGMYFS